MAEVLKMKNSQIGQKLDPEYNNERDQYLQDEDSSEEVKQELDTVESTHTPAEINSGDANRTGDRQNPMSSMEVPPEESHDHTMKIDAKEQPWFRREDVDELHSHWTTIQMHFVDEPCSAVEQAEAIVAETVERAKQMISTQQQSLDQQWINHENISTEELRIVMQNYRSLLNHLLNL